MCIFGGGSQPVDNSAEIARQEEAARQARITEGRTAIDDAFGAFTPDYFDSYANDYTGFYTPKLDDKYADARKKLTLQLASTGNLTGSAGIGQLRDLTEMYNEQTSDVTNKSLAAANTLRGNVENARSDLYSQNSVAADPGNAAESAARQIGILQQPQQFSPLGDVFSSFFANLNNNRVANQQRSINDSGTGLFLNSSGSSGGSGRVVG